MKCPNSQGAHDKRNKNFPRKGLTTILRGGGDGKSKSTRLPSQTGRVHSWCTPEVGVIWQKTKTSQEEKFLHYKTEKNTGNLNILRQTRKSVALYEADAI